jgi:hypothetical protein
LAVMPLFIVSRHEDDPTTRPAYSATFGEGKFSEVRTGPEPQGKAALRLDACDLPNVLVRSLLRQCLAELVRVAT